MTRQVRLDEDVVALVEATADGYSLSAATNRVLRRVLATSPSPGVLSPETPDHRGEPGEASRSDPGASQGKAPMRVDNGVRANTRSIVRRARTFSGGCTHPLARRYGDRCAGCGATIR